MRSRDSCSVDKSSLSLDYEPLALACFSGQKDTRGFVSYNFSSSFVCKPLALVDLNA